MAPLCFCSHMHSFLLHRSVVVRHRCGAGPLVVVAGLIRVAWVASQDYCWRKGLPDDLVAYCNRHEQCEALALYPHGYSVSNRQKQCWASAFFKTGGNGSLDLATGLRLAPQAALLVKSSSWAHVPGFEAHPVREASGFCYHGVTA